MIRISRPSLLATLLLATLAVPTLASAATTEELEAKLQALAAQLDDVKSELAELKSQRAASNAPAPAAVETNPNFFGYGELNFSQLSNDSSSATGDVARFVIGMGYRFDDKTRLVSELEVEHAVASADDPGEIEVEQAYIERDLSNGMFAKAGLFLIPSGLLNESHEPTRYYGVFRNFVETAIIPTTWREGGVEVEGNTESGLRWNVGVTTSVDLSKWDATSEEGRETPLGSIHQELVLARAKDLGVFGALNYTGIPGLRLGGSVFTSGAGQGQPGFEDSRMLLWEGHARYNPGAFELSALYARGHISNTRAINLTLVGNPTLIPEDFFGWYVEGAWHAWQTDSMALSPFVRYETFNTGSSYANLGIGLTPDALEDRKVWTGGLNFSLAPGVVIKVDYLKFTGESAQDRFDLGLGYQF